MRLLAIASCMVLAGLAPANITEQHSVFEICLCLTGTNVNARSSPGLSASVVGSVSSPSCFKFHGGIVTKDGYLWLQLDHVHGHTAWVAWTFLSIGDSSKCTSGSSSSSGNCTDTVAKDLACKLKALADAGNITLWKEHKSGFRDNAYAYNNIRDTCDGHAASRSSYPCSPCPTPGGTVCLSRTLLQYIYNVTLDLGYIHVNEIAGACHGCGSKHYKGLAVDLHITEGSLSVMRQLCKDIPDAGYLKERSHVHCQVPQ